ncbi:pentatricopeptide repeat-containing protein MRL1, chloroplastic isoform X2 [Asparagus officinalis]|uniref:pentatricopeptide repeat-containing protein MRL1, chloroplastic isoform X2 n=1 Tax=Asparagus officinalis TaxID=4686 RepID=UPI00098DF82F|nr:pentatricopeptide repeat-containing protein MRL1, chloroplastic isoform X2 [Asparagus officinalis]
MEVSITAKPKTLASSLPLSSQFQLPASIRRQFLGCGAHLRPSGLRSRARKRELGFRVQSPRCLLSNPMDEGSILAVAAAVATLATMHLVYMNYKKAKRGDAAKFSDDGNVDVMVNRELCKLDEDILEHEAVGNQPQSSENRCKIPFEKGNAFLRRENMLHEEVYDSDVKDVKQLVIEKAGLLGEESLINEVQPGLELNYPPTCSELPGVDGFVALTSSLAKNELKAVQEGDATAKMPNCLLQNEGGMSDAISPIVVTEPFIEKKSGNTNQNTYELGHIATKHGETLISSNVGPLAQPTGEVSSYKGKRQPLVKSMSRLNYSSIKPRDLTVSQLGTALAGANILAKRSPLTAEGQTLIGCLKESAVSQGNELIEVQDITRHTKTFKNKINYGDFYTPPLRNGFPRDVNGSTTYLRTYDRLLRDGRLGDCIDLLERIESKGLLDMDKVHHMKFLKSCKSQKAIKEAFRFCKLIQKPTLSTFNMLLSVCASAQDFDGAFQAMLLVKEAGLNPDCKLYTTLISTCAKSGKVDAMFEIFHEMVNAGVDPNLHTYGALIDGCARAGQVAKAFGAYGIMRSKKVQPDRVIFNALITACGQSGAVDRAFDVLAEMRAEAKPIDPDHVTVGALMKTCIQAGQVDRVRAVYEMLHKYNIKGTPDVYTIAVKSCSETGDLEFALSIYSDMKKNGVVPDEMFLSTLIDVAGHAGKVDTAFEILQDARSKRMQLGNVTYSSLMGACCNANNWQKALELYEEIKAIKLLPTVSTLNALVTSLCDGDQLLKSVEVLDELKQAGVQPNTITYSILIVACEKKDEAELGFTIFSKAKEDGIPPNQIMCRCLTGLCLKSLEKAHSLGEPIVTFNSGKPQIDSKWTSWAIMVYRETISAGVIPTIEVFSQVLGCLQFPRDSSLRSQFIENLGFHIYASRCSNICSLLDGFGEYDTRSFSVLEEAASLGVIPRVSFKDNPIVVDARKLLIHTVEVHLLTILKFLKHRLAAGARLPSITILLLTEKTQIKPSNGERRTVNVAGRTGQAAGSLLRRLGIQYSGDESYGKIRISGLALRRWFRPKLSEASFSGKPGEMIPIQARLAKGIAGQQRDIRSYNLSLE